MLNQEPDTKFGEEGEALGLQFRLRGTKSAELNQDEEPGHGKSIQEAQEATGSWYISEYKAQDNAEVVVCCFFFFLSKEEESMTPRGWDLRAITAAEIMLLNICSPNSMQFNIQLIVEKCDAMKHSYACITYQSHMSMKVKETFSPLKRSLQQMCLCLCT